MVSVMTWNLENLERPATNAEQAVKDRYARKLQQIAELITSAGPDLVGVQEVLADPKNSLHRPSTIFAPRWVGRGSRASLPTPHPWQTWRRPLTTDP
jgi:endonuclease/exonuclease/phosphatase family metal-dependent hydrolase